MKGTLIVAVLTAARVVFPVVLLLTLGEIARRRSAAVSR